jgi:hypothetical protein
MQGGCAQQPGAALRRHLVGKHLPRRLRRDVRRLLDLLQLLALVLDLLDAGAPIEGAGGSAHREGQRRRC